MSKTKKIITIVALTLVVLLVTTTIVLAVVPKQYYDVVYRSTSATADYIGVYSGGKGNTYDKNSDQYAKVVELYKKSTKENLLLSIFEGSSKFKTSIESYTSNVYLNNSENTYVAFKFNEMQTLKYNDAAYKNTSGNEVQFDVILVSVTNDGNYMQSVNVYIGKETSNTIVTPSYRIVTLAKQHELISYINSLELIPLV